MLPIPCILVPIPPSSFPCEGTGGGVGGEKPIAITSFLFFACIPGIVIDMAPYVGCETIGAVLTLVEGFGDAGAFKAPEGVAPSRWLDGEASRSVSTTVGTLFADGGGLYLGAMESSWSVRTVELSIGSEEANGARAGSGGRIVSDAALSESKLLNSTGPADSRRLLLVSEGTSNGLVLATSETTRSRSSRCLRSATTRRIASNPFEMLGLPCPSALSKVGLLMLKVDDAGDDAAELDLPSLASARFFLRPAHCTPHFWNVSLACATAFGLDASAAVAAAAARVLRFIKKELVDVFDSVEVVLGARLEVLAIAFGWVLC
jgi:hypothetical protein